MAMGFDWVVQTAWRCDTGREAVGLFDSFTMNPIAKPILLVVDDQPINIQTLYQVFKDGHEVFMATSGEQALKFCTETLPDLILLDVVMPGMDGHTVCTHLKADPRTHDIPVIFVTAHNDPQEETIGLQLGAVDFISKPINAAVVRARVHAQLTLRRTLREVQELNENLEERVARRTTELEQALDSLQQSRDELAHSEAKATLSTMIASVSHELGTPLGNSKMIASTLADQTRTLDQLLKSGQVKRSDLDRYMSQAMEGAALMESNLQRAVKLLENFHQVAADQASEQRRSFHLAAVVNEILHALSPSLKRHPHRIVVDIAADLVMDSQPGSLGQIVINLINNAYLHAFEGRTDGVLTISAQLDGDDVLLHVADNGVGMAPEQLEKMFEPFFSTKIGRGGTGLGMAIVQNLVNKTLHGRVDVASTPGQGTCFTIRIPRVLPEA
jgi:signal transduction histidine kinase